MFDALKNIEKVLELSLVIIGNKIYNDTFLLNNEQLIKRCLNRAIILNNSYEINICEFCVNTDKYLCKYCYCVDCGEKFCCISQKYCKIKLQNLFNNLLMEMFKNYAR